jgi:hypothetical protein
MPASSTINLSIDNDLVVESSGLYKYQVYYTQNNESVLAGEFDAHDSNLSFDISGVYGDVFIDVYFLSEGSSSIVSSKMLFLDYPIEEISSPYVVSDFSILNPGGDNNDITAGGTISNPAEFDSPNVKISWDTQYPEGHVKYGDIISTDFDLSSDYGLNSFSVKILDKDGSYVPDETLNRSPSLTSDINLTLDQIPQVGFMPITGTEYMYGYVDVESPLTGVTGYTTGIIGTDIIEVQETGVIEELVGITGYEEEVIPGYTGLKQKYKTITGTYLDGYTTGEPTYNYITEYVQTGMLLPDPSYYPSGVVEYISGTRVDYEQGVAHHGNIPNYISVLNNGYGVGQSISLETGRDLHRLSFYKLQSNDDDYFEIDLYMTDGAPETQGAFTSFDSIFYSGRHRVSLSEGWRHLHLPALQPPITGSGVSGVVGKEDYSFFLFNRSSGELKIAQSTGAYTNETMLENASLAGWINPLGETEISGVNAYQSVTDLAFSIDYGSIPTEIVDVINPVSGQILTGYETGLIPVYHREAVYIERPLMGTERISGVTDYLYGITGYETVCDQTGVIGTGVVDYYISPINFSVEHVTGYLTGCLSESTVGISGITGEVSGVIQEVVSITGYESVFSGIETRGITGYATGVISELFELVDLSYSYERPVFEKVRLDAIYGHDTGAYAEVPLTLQSGMIAIQTLPTGELVPQYIASGIGDLTGIEPLYDPSDYTGIIYEDGYTGQYFEQYGLSGLIPTGYVSGYTGYADVFSGYIVSGNTGITYEENVPIFLYQTEEVEDGFETGVVDEYTKYNPLEGVTGYITGVTGVFNSGVEITGTIPLIGITGTGLKPTPYITGIETRVIGHETGITGYLESGLTNTEFLSRYTSTSLDFSYNTNLEIFGYPNRTFGVEITPVMESGISIGQPPDPASFYLDNKIPTVTYNVLDGEHNKMNLSFQVHNGTSLKVYRMFEENYMQFADPNEFETGLGSSLVEYIDEFSDIQYRPTGEKVDFIVNPSPSNPHREFYSLVFDGGISPAKWELPYNKFALTKLVPEDDFGTGVQNGIYYDQLEPLLVESFASGVINQFSGYVYTTGIIPQYYQSGIGNAVGFPAYDPSWTGDGYGPQLTHQVEIPLYDYTGLGGETDPIYRVITGYETGEALSWTSGYQRYENIITGYETGFIPSGVYSQVSGLASTMINSGTYLSRSDLAPLKIDASIISPSFEDLNNQKDMKFSWRVTQVPLSLQVDSLSGAVGYGEDLNIVNSRHLRGFTYGFWDAEAHSSYSDFQEATSVSGENIRNYSIKSEIEKSTTLTYAQNIHFFPPNGARKVGFFVELKDAFDVLVDKKFSLGYIQPPIISGVTVDNATPRQITFNYDVIDELDYAYEAPYGTLLDREMDYLSDDSPPSEVDLEILAQTRSGQVMRSKEDKISNLRKIELYSGSEPGFDVNASSFAGKVDGVASNATVYPYLPKKVRERDYYYKFLTYDHFGSGYLSEPIKATVLGTRAPSGIKPSNINLVE